MAVRRFHQPDDVEHKHLRTSHAKHFLTPDGKHKVITSASRLHWHDGNEFVDIDCDPVSPDGDISWTTTSTPYRVNWNTKTLTLSYKSHKGGEASVRLVALDGQPPPQPSAAKLTGKRRVSCLVGVSLELELVMRPMGVELFKILHGPEAPKSLTWEVIENGKVNLHLMSTSGFDNLKLTAKRDGEFTDQRRIEMSHSRTPSDAAARIYSVTETFTGRTRWIDQETRARIWVDEVVYPVKIDVTFTENPTSDADDGFEITGTWYSDKVRFDTSRTPGFRFQTVTVPQGQTLDSATLDLDVLDTTGAFTISVFGNAVDNAPAWANSAGPNDMTTTADSTTLNAGTTGHKVLDVKLQAQGIVNRAGWASGNAMAFGARASTASGAGVGHIGDTYYGITANNALLTIVYTPAGGGVFGSNFYRQVAGMGGGF